MQAFSSHDIFQTLYQQIMLLELKPGSTLRENAQRAVGFPHAGAQRFAGSCALPG
ncbi:MAG: hypothetical protein ACLVJT_05875 [Subdoligranulum sp.]